ncbi:glycosyltransferase family 4 protein [Nocardioides limicola]|uniref:glycosyltransferase family 4 protein n=1 Tax=Nocardioides limicola TaxID=2803368 RepID=UPI00193C41DA|nr:glycosyltransferase family 4 protein [Nocardioides sp. DJM-14]
MRILVHDYSGHPFQAELSRELSGRGHEVTHSWCAAHVSGRGRLAAEPGESIRFDPIGVGEKIDKLSFGRRLVQELRFGGQLIRQVRRLRPDVVLAGNVPIPMLVVVTAWLWVTRVRWVLWHQDVQGIAVRSFAGEKLHPVFRLVAVLIAAGERWACRRAAGIVVISDAFLDVHRGWGTADKTVVIPNWAPIDEIVPTERLNPFSREHGLDSVKTLVYSGTLGLKHNPELLVGLAREVLDAGIDLHLCVVSEGPAMDVIAQEAARLAVPVTLLPFQPYERLPEVLGSGDVLVVLLEKSAGAFSVPSKTLSYLCAGRPVLGLMPAENLAATLIDSVGGCVLPPEESSLAKAGDWVRRVLEDRELADRVGAASRELAEREFALAGCADRFEALLATASS